MLWTEVVMQQPSEMQSVFTKKMMVCYSSIQTLEMISKPLLPPEVKLIISQIFTAANYEYCVYWILRQDGTIKLEIRLTGILNTYICADGEDIGPWGTVVYQMLMLITINTCSP